MAGPIARVLSTLELLQSHNQLSGAELANRLGVDRRTVRRYITVLEDMGVPVTTEQGRHGGYMLIPGYKLPPMMFTEEETLAISLGLLAARQLGLADANPALEIVQAKLERVMPSNLKQQSRAVSETTKLMLAHPTPLLADGLLLTLTRAVQAEQRIGFQYTAPEKAATERETDPYGILFHRGRWYLSGYCHLRQAMRSFRLDRMQGAKLLPHHFTRPPNFDAGEHFIRSLYAMPMNHRVRIILHTDMETATKAFSCHPNAEGLFQPHKDGLLLDTETDSFDWFASWLAQLHFRFSVVEPDELKAVIKRRAEDLIAACR